MQTLFVWAYLSKNLEITKYNFLQINRVIVSKSKSNFIACDEIFSVAPSYEFMWTLPESEAMNISLTLKDFTQ